MKRIALAASALLLATMPAAAQTTPDVTIQSYCEGIVIITPDGGEVYEICWILADGSL